jgi:hypothetical protein
MGPRGTLPNDSWQNGMLWNGMMPNDRHWNDTVPHGSLPLMKIFFQPC